MDLSRPRKKRKLNDSVADQIRAKQRERALLLAVIRSANVRSSMQDFFHRINSELAPVNLQLLLLIRSDKWLLTG
jgi:hypothetical protein